MARVKTRVEGVTHFQAVCAETTYKVGTASSNTTLIDAHGRLIPRVRIVAGEALTKGHLLYASGYNTTTGNWTMKKADADAGPPSGVAWLVAEDDIDSAAVGYAVGEMVLDANTSGVGTAGDPIYLHTTAGGWTHTAPTTNRHTIQQVGIAIDKTASGHVWLCPFYSKATTRSHS